MSEQIIHTIAHVTGGNESTRCYLVIDKSTGRGQVVIEKTISKRLPMANIQEAEAIYKKLTDCKGGRRLFGIDDLIKHIDGDKECESPSQI